MIEDIFKEQTNNTKYENNSISTFLSQENADKKTEQIDQIPNKSKITLRKRQKVDYQNCFKKNDIEEESEYEDENYKKKLKKK